MANLKQIPKSKAATKAAYVSPVLKITSKRDNFWRAGIVHSGTEVTHEAGKFTEDQVEQLLNEPMLVVYEVPAEAAADATETPAS